jgi:hypothetical protein
MTVLILRQIQSDISELRGDVSRLAEKLSEHDKRFDSLDERYNNIVSIFGRVDRLDPPPKPRRTR